MFNIVVAKYLLTLAFQIDQPRREIDATLALPLDLAPRAISQTTLGLSAVERGAIRLPRTFALRVQRSVNYYL